MHPPFVADYSNFSMVATDYSLVDTDITGWTSANLERRGEGFFREFAISWRRKYFYS